MEPKKSEFVLVQDTQRKCFYLTLSDALKNAEGLKVVEKFPNEMRAIDALKKYTFGQKVFGKMRPKLSLKDAVGDLADNHPNDNAYTKPLKKQ